MKILKIKIKPSEYMGKPVKTISGHMTYTKILQILVDEIPKNMVFKKIGKFFYAEKDGFVRIYKHEPGTSDGFAGRKITLNVQGEEREFHGSLWDPMGFSDMSNIPEYRAISITTEPEVMERGYTFYDGYVTKELYDELMATT